MQIRIVRGYNRSKSKYDAFWRTFFDDESINELRDAIEQIKSNPYSFIEIDISPVKQLTQRKNPISERGSISDDGQINKNSSSLAKSFARFLLSHNITGVRFTIKEDENGSVILKISSLNPKKQECASTSN